MTQKRMFCILIGIISVIIGLLIYNPLAFKVTVVLLGGLFLVGMLITIILKILWEIADSLAKEFNKKWPNWKN